MKQGQVGNCVYNSIFGRRRVQPLVLSLAHCFVLFCAFCTQKDVELGPVLAALPFRA